jgi:hypothetical protein
MLALAASLLAGGAAEAQVRTSAAPRMAPPHVRALALALALYTAEVL